ncbi:CDP-alcohol phosphatidyltransferase family protein [Nesterenkonia salmonea]|uniref:CDP-alcohol phosphatidyltransferase family protein n=1 Tax=Nesterenkonia salmonea TaxID=1804987 RepID=A0A5R9BER9_9MICC|nr:CDP-alcohol phosphatidyltransferase family protein [Nesterenkonia salmonea]TLP98612.1 CDP-alcohol phosphatidyltransferase family protein [Nesterenkonia salmonea]
MTGRPVVPASGEQGGAPTGRVDSVLTVICAVAGAYVLTALYSPSLWAGVVSVASSSVIPVIAAVSVMRRRPPMITPADRVTLLRVALIGMLTGALVLTAVGALPVRTWTVLILASLAAVLDAVDGWVARHAGRGTAAGARLDGEADAAALLVLSALLAMTVGWWVLLIGLMRYLFVAGSLFRRSWRRRLPYSGFRRVVAACQATAVVVGLGPVVPIPVAGALAATALAALVLSFGRDILLLERVGRSAGSTPHGHWEA